MSGDERRGPDEESGGDADAAEGSPEGRADRDPSERDDPDAPDEEPTDLDALPYAELQSLASDHGFSPVGYTAAELRERIAAARAGGEGARGADPTDAEPAADDDAGVTESDDDGGSEGDPADGSVPDWVKSDESTVDDTLGDDRPAAEDPDAADPRASDHGLRRVDDEDPTEGGADAESDGEDRAQSDGGATVVDGPVEADAVDYDYYDDDGGAFGSGPEHDEEMPLADHIEEMVKRLGVVIIAMAFVSVLTLPFAVELIDFIWYSILGTVQGDVTSPRAFQPLALVLARLKVATLAGFVVALPVFVYETYLFMRPGLYDHERRYYLAAVPTSLVLAVIGVAFAFYLVLPFIFSYFVSYSEQAAEIAFGLTETFGLMLLLMGFFAAVFQIPLLIMLAVMMGLTTREWLVDRRLYFWGGFLGVALLFSPDPTGMAPFIVAITMVVLFEGTLLLLRWTGR